MSNNRVIKAPALKAYQVMQNGNSISGLSSGAFMTVQLHLAHSTSFIGAGIIAGGPYRCAESFRQASTIAVDANAINALTICMTPLTTATAPSPERSARLARQTAAAGLIDPTDALSHHRLYIFTGSKDTVVDSKVVKATRDFYELLGVNHENIKYIDTVPAGHSIITNNIEDSPLGTNQPPYINYSGSDGHRKFIQSHDILNHIYSDHALNPPTKKLSSQLEHFDQTEFFADTAGYASMSPYGYVYVPQSVKDGAPARGVHIVIHGCKQGYEYANFVAGHVDSSNEPPYGARYMLTTGYNEFADANDLIMLYPQATGTDNNKTQNPDGCWDWWGYTSKNVEQPDYFSKDALQIQAIFRMLQRLCGNA